MLLLNNIIGAVKQTGSNTHLGITASSVFKVKKTSSSLLVGLVVASAAFLLPTHAEAAKPKARIVKIAPVNEGETVTLDASNSTDRDGDPLSFSWEQVNGEPVTINPVGDGSTATFTAPNIIKTNKPTKPAKLRFRVAVDDGNKAVKKSVLVKVKPVNNPPVANAGMDRTVTWTDAAAGISLDASGSTDDGQIVKYRWKLLTKNGQRPKKSKLKFKGAKSSNPSFTFSSPDQTSPVPLAFQLTVFDNDKQKSTSIVNLTVSNDLPAPVANAGNAQTVDSGASVNLNGDLSTNAESYMWEQTAGDPVSLSATNTANVSFTAPTVTATTVLTFKLTVTNATASSDASVSITVNPASTLAANAGNDKTVASGATASLDGSQSTGADSYLWEQTAGTTVNLSSTNTATTGFTAPIVTAEEVLTFKLTVAKGTDTATDSVNVTVTPSRVGNFTGTLTVDAADIDLNDPINATIADISGGVAPYKVTFDWGDGKSNGPTTLDSGVTTLSHEYYYADVGSHTLTVTVVDANNQSKEFTTPITVASDVECN